jgi:fumarate hydratase class II
VRALGVIKKACAEANKASASSMPKLADAIIEAAQEVVAGKLDDISRWWSGRPARARSRT